MNLKKFLLVIAIIGTLMFYLLKASELSAQGQWGIVGLLMAEFVLFIFMPGPKQEAVVRRRTRPAASAEEEAAAEAEAMDLPEAVTEDSMSGASLRQRKMVKIQSRQAEAELGVSADGGEDEGEEEIITVEVEEEAPQVHVAEEYVVEVSAQSVEDADIEDTVNERRDHHARIRKRIEDRRRGQMADIRASTAKMWEDHDSGEDLLAVLSVAGHGMAILEEPEEVEAGHPYGSSFIRIDESRVLRMRVPLDSGFKSVEAEDEPELPMLPGMEGLPPPPPGPLPDLSLPLPPPPTGAQSALADLKSEMDD